MLGLCINKARPVISNISLISRSSEPTGDPAVADSVQHTYKMHKALYQLTSILMPLLEDNDKANHVVDENDKNKKKNKSNNKLLNGNDTNKTKNKNQETEQDSKAVINNDSVINNGSVINNVTTNNINTVMYNVENYNNNNHTDVIIADEVKTENSKKKNKKHKNHNEKDKPKLSKSSSVCSSLSDMSKASNKSEKRPQMNIDAMFLERLLNELNRVVEKIDRVSYFKFSEFSHN